MCIRDRLYSLPSHLVGIFTDMCWDWKTNQKQMPPPISGFGGK